MSSIVGFSLPDNAEGGPSHRLDLLDKKIREKLGLKLTERELKSVRMRYDKRSVKDDIDTNVEHLKQDIRNAELPGAVEQSTAYHSLSIEKIYELLREKINVRARSLGSSDSQIQEAVYLLSENRSPFLTRSQLQFGVSVRLNIHLSDRQIEEIFHRFDPNNTGVIKLMEFVKTLLDDGQGENRVATIALDNRKNNLGKSSRGVEPTITYDHKVINLESSAVPVNQRLTLPQIENIIRYKISERSFRGRNVQTLHKCFSDTRSGDAKKDPFISRDQIRYTLFKRFQLRLCDEEIDLLFAKYDPEKRGKIPIRRFVHGIIEEEENANEPLIEEKYRGAARFKSQTLINFLDFLRKKLHNFINREGRAPHYLIHVTGRMTAEQTKAFLLEKFRVVVDDKVMAELAEHYDSNQLIDVKLLMLDVMTVESKNIMGPEKSLVDGCVVVVDELPASLRGVRFSPEQIDEILIKKLSERMKNEHPMSSLHKMFRGTGVADTRFVTEQGMQQLLNRFDIYMSTEDFNVFFKKHDRGDGKIDTRKFLQHLLPPGDYRENPFTPKSQAEFKAEVKVAQKINRTLGGGSRVIDELNGPSYARLEDRLISNVLDEKPSQPETVHEDIGLKSKVKPVQAYNKALYYYDESDPMEDVEVYSGDVTPAKLEHVPHPPRDGPAPAAPLSSGDPYVTMMSGLTDFHSTVASRPLTTSPRPSHKKQQSRSPRVGFVNTGQPRVLPVNITSDFLGHKYSISQKATNTSNQSYGIYFKSYMKQKAANLRIEERNRKSATTTGPVAPTHSQHSPASRTPRMAHIKERAPISLDMKLANSFH